MDSSENILYTTSQDDVKLEVIVQDETVWLTQKAMSELVGLKNNLL